MLRNLFNNSWFIGALGLFASIYLGYAIIKPLFFEGDAELMDVASVEGAPVTLADTQYDAAGQTVRAEAVNSRERIGWLHETGRDPFAGTERVFDGPATQVLPRLEALFISHGVQAAVVNKKLVRVGDEVAHYRVAEIGKNHVNVLRAGKSYRLEPEV